MTSNENEFRLAIHNALCSCFGLSPSSEQALSLIRQAYTEPENNPQPARTADVIYWSLSPGAGEDPASYNETAASSGSHKPTVHRYLARGRHRPAARRGHRRERFRPVGGLL